MKEKIILKNNDYIKKENNKKEKYLESKQKKEYS